MSATSDGKLLTTDTNTIESVIEKLQELVGDLQHKKQSLSVSTSKLNDQATCEDLNKESEITITSDKDGATIVITPSNTIDNDGTIKESTKINILPMVSKNGEKSTETAGPSKQMDSKEKTETGTSVVITTQKGSNPSQVVLNFPVDSGEFNVKNTQGLVDTLLKLNSILSKGKDSGQKSLYTYQKGDKTTTEVQLYKCAKCDYWSHNKYYLKQHVDLVHNAERVYKCPFCDYAGKRSHSLKEHLVVHSNYRPYVCSQCNASFRKKGHLTNHIKMHSSYKESNSLLCPICMLNNFENLLALHIHLRERHPKEVYACDVCQYATFLNKGNITMHMLTHGSPKVYACSTCNFTALHDRIMDQHISETHTDSASGNKLSTAVSVMSTDGNTQKQFPKIFLKCSECGFSTDERGILHDHMISKHLEALKEKSISEQGLSSTESTEGKSNPDSSTKTSGSSTEVKVEKETNLHRCTQCSFQTLQVSSFIKHMLNHKQENSTAIETSGVKSTDSSKANVCTDAVGNPSVVQRLQGERNGLIPSQKSPIGNQPYTYDESNKWYQCMICGYSSEQQRTIKAHIWKHSGHKDLDYPMFQNGPISVYDETPIGVPMLLKTEENDNEEAASNNTNSGDQPSKDSQGQNQPTLPIKTEKLSAKDDQNKTAESISKKHVIYVRVSDDKVIDHKQFENQIPRILKQLNATEGEYRIVQTQNSTIVNEVSVRLEKQELQDTSSSISTTSHDATESFNELPNIQGYRGTSQENKGSGGYNEESKALHEEDVPTSSSGNSSGGDEIVVDDHHFDIQEEVVESEKENVCMDKNATHMKKRKLDSSSTNNLVHPSKKSCIEQEKMNLLDEGVVVQDMSQIYTTPNIEANQSDLDMRNVAGTPEMAVDMSHVAGPPEMAVEISVVSSQTPPKRMLSIDNTSSSDDEDSQMSGSFDQSDAEVITLLSLLKKGPNYNPACPIVGQRNLELGDDEDSMSSTLSSNQQRQGISSSLLAVIEQLRERTISLSDTGQNNGDISVPSVKSNKRKRQEKIDSEQTVLNIEAVPDGGYRCLSCFYTHPSFEALKMHMKLHQQDRQPYECSLCDYKGKSSEDLQDHMLQHCKLRTYQCKMCDASFNYKSQLRAHMSAHPMSCNKCEYETSNPAEFRAHVKLHENNKKLYICQKCGMTFQQKEDADSHPPYCTGFPDKANNKNRGKRQYKCEYCPAIANTQAVLKAHMRTHDVSQSLQCDLCGFLAFSVRSLKSHMKRHINDQRFVQQPLEQYKCNLCGYVCHHLPSLKSHMWRHSSDKNYNYEEINEIINRALEYDGPESEDSVKDHQSVDSAGHLNYLIMFRCCQCGFESVHKSSLNAHMKTHMDIIQKTLEVNQDRLVSNKNSFGTMSKSESLNEGGSKMKPMSSTIVQVHVKE